jgi:hypothetical protein
MLKGPICKRIPMLISPQTRDKDDDLKTCANTTETSVLQIIAVQSLRNTSDVSTISKNKIKGEGNWQPE